MIIENSEAFKGWMVKVLEPLCDADPQALAKHIYAPVKKDKPIDALRDTMIPLLEVFLDKETTNFVDQLIEKLPEFCGTHVSTTTGPPCGVSSTSICPTNVVGTNQIRVKEEPMDISETGSSEPPVLTPQPLLEEAQVNGAVPQTEESINLHPKPVVAEPAEAVNPPATSSDITIPLVADVSTTKEQQAPVREESPRLRNGSYESSAQNRPLARERRLSSSRSHDQSERETRGEASRWRGSSVSPPSRGRVDRSRSRSWERRSTTRRSRSKSRRSRSRGRERDRSRAWRNKSPPLRNRYDRDRKMRSWSKSPPPRSRSRSPQSKMRTRYRNRSPVGRSRSRSHSPYDSPHMSGGATPNNDSNHGDEPRTSHSIQSVVHAKKRRCRDFDEKGFCMRGEMCPYDHGKDPVVLEDVGQVLSFSGPVIPPPTLEPPNPTLVPPGLVLHHRPQLMNRPSSSLAEYNPDAPSMEPRMWPKQPFRTAAGRGLMQRGGAMRMMPGFPPNHQRELISVPVVEGEEHPQYYNALGTTMKRQCPPEFNHDMEPPMKQRFDYSRLGGRLRTGNCSLQLKKVPAGLNNIAHLHNHFYKFGKIVNIQVSFEGDPEAALITFTSHAEASAAYKSTEAVLNNRFIKVFWHNPQDRDKKQENLPNLTRTSAKERLGAPVNNVPPSVKQLDRTDETEKVLISGKNITKTVYIPTALDKKQAIATPAAQRMIVQTTFTNSQEIQANRGTIRKKQEEKRKEALKLTQHLCKRKHDLIEKLLFHQKQLIDKLEKGNVTPEQRAEILSTIQGFQENIDMIRQDIKMVVAKPLNNAVKVSPQLVKRTREEVGDSPASDSSPQNSHTQKQILDAELDLFNNQQEGKDTAELQKRVLELKTKAHNLGLLAHNGVLRLSRGGARFRSSRGRGGYNPHVTVDHRPTKLLVSGFESDDKADVLEHFSQFGEMVDHIWDESTPALVIHFKTRKDAETAMAKGRNFQDRLLSVTWFSSAQNMGMRSSSMRSVILLNDDSMGDLLSEQEDEEEALRINLDQNEDFLLQDEEEDDDEERSWRR